MNWPTWKRTYPGTVFLHTGFQTPIEEGGDRGQFHSKIVLLEMAGTERCIILGSHNWTQNALQGYNMEAGMILRCQESDTIVAQVRQHIEACARPPASEPFSRQRLRFYETIQRDLHRHIGPGSADSEDFPGFEPMDALVMHAEDATGNGIPRPLQLFIPVRDSRTRDFFPDGRRVLLYVYPAGSLLGQSPPTASPTAYEGSVTMTNVAAGCFGGRDARRRAGSLTSPNRSSSRCPVEPVPRPPAVRFPRWSSASRDKGEGELPIFHAAGQLPKMKLGVEYEAVDRDAGDQQATLKRDDTEAPDGEDEALPAYLAPRHLTLEANIKVPSRNLYRSQIEKILKWFLFNCDLFDESMVPSLTIADPAPAMMLTPFVYQVNHFLSKETMARVEKQLRLFRD